MLSVLMLFGVFALPFLGVTLVPPARAMPYVSSTVVVGGLLVWLLLVWSMALAAAWPLFAAALRTLPG